IDVVGYTLLMGRDEEGTLARLQECRQLVEKLVAAHDGRTFGKAGDSVLAEFASPVMALRAALAIQAEMEPWNARLSEDDQMLLRIGINLGDALVDDENLYGDGVNIAARLEQMADPGGILVSDDIARQTIGKVEATFEAIGEQHLKNVALPVLAHRVLAAEAVQVLPTAKPRRGKSRSVPGLMGGALVVVLALAAAVFFYPKNQETVVASRDAFAPVSDKRAIAVLPFANMSGDPEQVYFSDGLSEDLITDLSRVSGLLVISSASSFAYRNSDLHFREIAQELGVSYLLQGSVRKADDRVRINANLIDVSNGANVWAERYDHEITNIFELQDNVTKSIVGAMSVSLTQSEEQLFESSEKVDPDAYDTLLRGLYPYRNFTLEGVREARIYFKKAIELDPDYARAHANLAASYGREIVFLSDEPKPELLELGLKEAAIAERLDDKIPQTQFAVAVVNLAARNHAKAITASRRTIELDPNYADGFAVLAQTSTYGDNLEEGLLAIRRAKQLNPRHPFSYLWVEGHILYLLERYTDALPLFEEVVSRNASFYFGQLALAATYGQLGLMEEAEWQVEEVLTLQPSFSAKVEGQKAPYMLDRDRERFVDGLVKAGLPE
ncbi:MAG: hypothetical protein GY947_22975, partial [Rhodobacteraceae bacterium]|nr:hypothetical protein [Paracoccaceae bacterium]